MRCAPTRRGSRLRPGRPAARPRYAASVWSGPTLKPAVVMPRAAHAARRPTAIAVLPCPDAGALITRRGWVISGPPHRRTGTLTRYSRGVYRFVLTPRWLGALALAVAAGVAMVFLGIWQLHRYEERAATNDRIDAAASAVAVPLSGVLAEPADPGRAGAAPGHDRAWT